MKIKKCGEYKGDRKWKRRGSGYETVMIVSGECCAKTDAVHFSHTDGPILEMVYKYPTNRGESPGKRVSEAEQTKRICIKDSKAIERRITKRNHIIFNTGDMYCENEDGTFTLI